MITQLSIQNFKSLRQVDITLRRLTLLTGLNSSGKSSVIQVLLMLRQSQESMLSSFRIVSNGVLLDFGTFDKLLYRKAAKKTFNFRIEDDRQNVLSIDTLEEHFSADPYIYVNLEGFQKNVENSHVKLQINGQNAGESAHFLRGRWIAQSLFNQHFQYLHPDRHFLIQPYYNPHIGEVIGNRALGFYGEHTPFFLITYKDHKITNTALHHPKAKSNNLLDQVNAWLSEISPDVRVEINLVKQQVQLLFCYGDEEYEPDKVGFGVPYVLPVIVSLLMAEEGRMIIIENPESHIHPRGQVQLGRLMALAAEAGAQLIIETHSDHVLNGLRIAVREKQVQPEYLIAYYCRRDVSDGASTLLPICIDAKAKLYQPMDDGTRNAALPKGFFDEWTNSMAKLF